MTIVVTGLSEGFRYPFIVSRLIRAIMTKTTATACGNTDFRRDEMGKHQM